MDQMKEKPVYLSKTVIGAVLSLLIAVFSVLGYEIENTAALQENITTIVFLIATTAVTVYGRFQATTKLVVKPHKDTDNENNN